MDRAKRLVWFRPGLVQSHAFLSEAASTRREQKSLNDKERASKLKKRYILLLLNRLKCSSPASLSVIGICKLRSHDELALRAEVLLVDSGADQTTGVKPGSRSCLSIQDKTKMVLDSAARFTPSRCTERGRLIRYVG